MTPRFMQPSMAAIKQAVADNYGVTVMDLDSHRRSADAVRPRHAAMWLIRKLTTRSLPEIGQAFGGRDHTTVHNALRSVESRLVYPEEYERMKELMSSIEAGAGEAKEFAEDRAGWALRELDQLAAEVEGVQQRLRRIQLALREAAE